MIHHLYIQQSINVSIRIILLKIAFIFNILFPILYDGNLSITNCHKENMFWNWISFSFEKMKKKVHWGQMSDYYPQLVLLHYLYSIFYKNIERGVILIRKA